VQRSRVRLLLLSQEGQGPQTAAEVFEEHAGLGLLECLSALFVLQGPLFTSVEGPVH